MTVQEARKELRSYLQHVEIRERRGRRVEELRAWLYRCPISKYGHEVGSLNPYRREELIDKLDKMERKYVAAVEKSVNLLAMIEEKVERLEGRHYTVLRKKYIEGLSYEQIAVDMHYTYEHVRKLEGQGVEFYKNL